jgi:DNA-binding NarL/FixJ family response regulator
MKKRILIIDSHPVYILKLEMFLKGSSDHEVVLARTAMEGMVLVISAKPDLVILSATLADGSGGEVCRYIRDKGLPVKIVVLIGLFTAQEEVDQLITQGADDVLIRKERDFVPLQNAIDKLSGLASGGNR